MKNPDIEDNKKLGFEPIPDAGAVRWTEHFTPEHGTIRVLEQWGWSSRLGQWGWFEVPVVKS